jgi:hypothetical protein
MNTICSQWNSNNLMKHKMLPLRIKLIWNIELIITVINRNIKSFIQTPSYTPLGHVSYCHHFSPVVCPSTFHILIFSSETTGPIATKLCIKSFIQTPSYTNIPKQAVVIQHLVSDRLLLLISKENVHNVR